MFPGDLVPREASVATTAAARQEDQRQRSHPQQNGSEAAARAAQLSLLFSAMRGDAQENAQTKAAAGNVWSWTSSDGSWGGAGVEGTTLREATAIASTPCRRWLCGDASVERRAPSTTLQQPTTQRKQLRLNDDCLLDCPAACVLASPVFPAVSGVTSGIATTGSRTATAVQPAELVKRSATVLNLNAVPFVPSRMGS
ncbi:hypothetical protein TraAM80_07820 [Trypanosoma rangeli]|uniref:Uncharacterized protein n=1 Tax=Trypanosoma rangeli TaxID=5698 RepID=A0A3R7NBJ7_TRYRA|nr:uncharacterized protein TraAM80_07820 [Trypanosoma rangeli]RNF00078.1 hypothetical protein TraAM80_07820 [Trypanosoma rangeli]|eukprot:RNF00078.1 hypothetical protein TraAM80_07820 [Trypanosoma rangeli]